MGIFQRTRQKLGIVGELFEFLWARKLWWLSFATRRFYGPHHRFYFRLAGLSEVAQRIGVDWVNGTGNLDEAAPLALAWRWARMVLFGPWLG